MRELLQNRPAANVPSSISIQEQEQEQERPQEQQHGLHLGYAFIGQVLFRIFKSQLTDVTDALNSAPFRWRHRASCASGWLTTQHPPPHITPTRRG